MNVTGISYRGGANGMWAGMASEGEERLCGLRFQTGVAFRSGGRIEAIGIRDDHRWSAGRSSWIERATRPAPSAPSCRRSGQRCDLALA
jgi:hypothetical protein